MKLTQPQRDLLRLIERSVTQAQDEWAPVSEMLCKVVQQHIVPELAEFQKLETGGRVRLTDKGITVLEFT